MMMMMNKMEVVHLIPVIYIYMEPYLQHSYLYTVNQLLHVE